MKYKTHSLIKSYGQEAAVNAAHALRHGLARLEILLERFWANLAMLWDESLLRRYFSCLCTDLSRCACMMRLRGYVALALSACALMSLGFLVVNPPSEKSSYHVRVDMSRPVITTLTHKEAMRLNPMSPYELATLYEAGTGKVARGWYSSGELSYEEALRAAPISNSQTGQPALSGGVSSYTHSWRSSRSFMGIENGQVTVHTALGAKSIARLGEVRQSTNITARPSRKLAAIGSGADSPEALLAELTLQNIQGHSSPRRVNPEPPVQPAWSQTGYGTGIFDAPARHWSGASLAESSDAKICRQDRMEQASWLNMLYASHSRRSVYTVRQAAHYRTYVEHYASQYSLQPSLVYAIMRVESGFNPLAISKANALGLMQVVPATAGNEVHAYLNGKKATPRPEVLFRPESNIQYGTTYLHLLMTRHFQEVKSPLSRELCIIAAYNGGPSAVYRVFSRNRERAMQQINHLTPEQLYAKLLKDLYSQETREYLPKVLAARNDFLRGQARIQ